MDRASALATRCAAAVTALLVAAALWGPEVVPHGVSDLLLRTGPPVSAAAAAVACFITARRTTGRTRDGWVLFGIACAGWAVGRVGAADNLLPVRMIAMVTGALAIVQWLRPALTAAGCMRVAADGLVVGSGLLFLGWPTVFLPVIERHQPGVDRLLALLAPIGDLSVLALVIVAGARVALASRRGWSMLALALVLFGIGDGTFAYVTIERVVHAHALKDVAWTVGALLIALAALRSRGDLTPLAQEPRPSREFHILLSYAPLVVAGAEATSRVIGGTLDRPSIAIAVALIALLFVRQLIAQFETLHLTRQLDGLVRDRTIEPARRSTRGAARRADAVDHASRRRRSPAADRAGTQ